MKPIFDFIKTTLVGGILLLVPLVLIVLLLQKAFQFAGKALAPIAHQLPGATLVGVKFPDLVAGLILLLVAFLAGLAAKTTYGRRLGDRVEGMVLRKVPGYTLLKSVTDGKLGTGSGGSVKVAMANIDDAWMIAFIIEERADGQLTVFVPSAPTPTSGSLYFLSESQVRRLDVPIQAAFKCIMQLGVGSQELLSPRKGEMPWAGKIP